MSGEHIASRALFPNGVVVRGFDWCKDDFKQLGPDALVTKCLCRDHNAQLSPLDQAVADVRYVMTDVGNLHSIRKRRPNYPWALRHYRVNGILFERWCFKFICNMYAGDAFLGIKEWKPPPSVVDFVYGKNELNPGCGMGVLVQAGESISNENHLLVQSSF